MLALCAAVVLAYEGCGVGLGVGSADWGLAAAAEFGMPTAAPRAVSGADVGRASLAWAAPGVVGGAALAALPLAAGVDVGSGGLPEAGLGAGVVGAGAAAAAAAVPLLLLAALATGVVGEARAADLAAGFSFGGSDAAAWGLGMCPCGFRATGVALALLGPPGAGVAGCGLASAASSGLSAGPASAPADGAVVASAATSTATAGRDRDTHSFWGSPPFASSCLCATLARGLHGRLNECARRHARRENPRRTCMLLGRSFLLFRSVRGVQRGAIAKMHACPQALPPACGDGQARLVLHQEQLLRRLCHRQRPRAQEQRSQVVDVTCVERVLQQVRAELGLLQALAQEGVALHELEHCVRRARRPGGRHGIRHGCLQGHGAGPVAAGAAEAATTGDGEEARGAWGPLFSI